MNIDQSVTKHWIKAVAAFMNLSFSELGKRSGVAPSTVTRFLNDDTGTVGISQRTLDQISAFAGIPVHRMPGDDGRVGIPTADAIPLDDSEPVSQSVKAAVDVFLREHHGVKAWRMKGWALDLLGVLPGDILIIDETKRAKAGDIVFALLNDWSAGSTESVFRLYQPPYIVAHSAKMGPQKPLMVDEDNVSLKGICLAVLRPRQ